MAILKTIKGFITGTVKEGEVEKKSDDQQKDENKKQEEKKATGDKTSKS